MVHIRGVVSPPFFEGSCIGGHKKRERYWGSAGARKKHSCSQYGSFMGIGRGIGELLESISSGRRKL
jgi:hypothetical protein